MRKEKCHASCKSSKVPTTVLMQCGACIMLLFVRVVALMENRNKTLLFHMILEIKITLFELSSVFICCLHFGSTFVRGLHHDKIG